MKRSPLPVLFFTKKDDVLINPEKIIMDFSDELLSVLLRDNLEKDNKEIREKIVSAAIANSLDYNNFVEMNTNNNQQQNNNQIEPNAQSLQMAVMPRCVSCVALGYEDIKVL
mgnify:CR=1 FL=1